LRGPVAASPVAVFMAARFASLKAGKNITDVERMCN
jgi:hypothetical protein